MRQPVTSPVLAYEIDGKIYPRSRIGEDWDAEEGVDRCGDCGEPFGQLHWTGCDIERCPRCRQQFLSCRCRDIASERTNSDLPHVLTIGVEGEKVTRPTWDLVRSKIDNLSDDPNSALMLERGNWFYVEANRNGSPQGYYLHIFEGEETRPLEIADQGVDKDAVVDAFRRVFDGDLSYRDVAKWQKSTGSVGCIGALLVSSSLGIVAMLARAATV